MSDEHRILVAGACGAIGSRLVPMLLERGNAVWGTTRSEARAAGLRALGAHPVVVDVFDAAGLARALADIRPQTVVHQLTDLPRGLPPERMGEAVARNARIRDVGTRNLLGAATAAGAGAVVAQSIAWAYAPGPEPHGEDDPLDLSAEGLRAVSVGGVAALERQVLSSPGLRGAVLRYGQIYGPGTGADAPAGSAPLHVDDAAFAALLAVEKRASGVFNIAEADAHVATAKARRDLGWTPGYRRAMP